MYFSLHFFRFTNLVENPSLERKVIQGHVKRLRIEYLIKNTDLTCENAFIPLKNILNNFEKLSQMVGVQTSQETRRNLTRSSINFGAEMFMALNSCPSFYVKLYWKAIYENESRMAEIASNIVRKANDDFKVSAQKIFAEISSVLGFQHISYHHDENKSVEMDIELSKNMLDIKGIKYFHD